MHRIVATVGVALSLRAPAADPFAFVSSSRTHSPLAAFTGPARELCAAYACVCAHGCVCEDVKRVSDRMYMGDKLLGIAWPCGITLVYEFYARETSIYNASRETSKR